jgi:uncharacterized membrane protein HdeD (DUF308 family)
MLDNPVIPADFDLLMQDMRHRWGWFLALGIILVLLGTFALFVVPAATLATVMVLGWIMIISGIVEAVQAFRVHRWGGFFMHMIGAVLGVLVGVLVVTHPVAGALAWTLLFAAFFTVIGIFRLVTAARLKFSNWGWAAFDGAITLVLGIMLMVGWPWSGLWFLGLALGVTMILRGWTYVMIAISLKALPAPKVIPVEAKRAA